jgi:hypothetical protein
MSATPGATPVTTPASTVATEGFEVDQAAVLPAIVAPVADTAFAVRVPVPPTVSVRLVGSMETTATVCGVPPVEPPGWPELVPSVAEPEQAPMSTSAPSGKLRKGICVLGEVSSATMRRLPVGTATSS